MGRYCLVPGCKSGDNRIQTQKITVHSLPKKDSLAQLWIKTTNRDGLLGKRRSMSNAGVCSLHFLPEDFIRDLQFELMNPGKDPMTNKKKRLKEDAVPFQNITNQNIERDQPLLTCRMTSEVLVTELNASPAYILPDDPPDLSTLGIKDEPQDPLATSSTATDDPPDLKPDLAILGVEYEPQDPLATSSTATDDPPSDTPGLSMSVEIKEEVVDTATPSSSAQGLANLSSGHNSYNRFGEKCERAHVKIRHGSIGRQCEPDREHNYCTTYGRNILITDKDKEVCICDDCKESFTSKRSLVRHRRIHADKKRYRCDDCGKVWARSHDLTIHRRIHTGEKPYRCDDCGEVFARDYTLTRHRVTHTGEKPCKCDDCGKLFSHRTTLAIHRRIHTGEKRYRCDDCGKRFSQSHQLTKHRRIHTGEKPYRCDGCGKMFSCTEHLARHCRIHTGEKPYKCDDCGKMFADRNNLLRHGLRHRREALQV